MAVYTKVSFDEARELLQHLQLGQLVHLEACTGGIENTNYFVTTQANGQTHDYVLTLFERLTFEQLPFYLQLMKHLAQRGIVVPEPQANTLGELVFQVKGKPAAVVDKLRGQKESHPGPAHCAQVGAMLAKMHLAGRDYALSQPNLRGLSWWNDTAPLVLPYLSDSQKTLLNHELALQNQIAATPGYAALPRGPIHADLFHDNVMFETVAGQPVLRGFFDFYFAGIDTWLFDLAVCLNDWCIDQASGTHHAPNAHHFLTAYNTVRPLQAAEQELLPAMLRAAALRFWLSRLWDFYLPRQAHLLQAHDPAHFERVLRHRASQALSYPDLESLT
jgi:homoserine kinase type II